MADDASIDLVLAHRNSQTDALMDMKVGDHKHVLLTIVEHLMQHRDGADAVHTFVHSFIATANLSDIKTAMKLRQELVLAKRRRVMTSAEQEEKSHLERCILDQQLAKLEQQRKVAQTNLKDVEVAYASVFDLTMRANMADKTVNESRGAKRARSNAPRQ